MAGYRYSLALASVVLTLPGQNPIRFGGQGSMIGTITLARKNERFSAEGDPTGGFVINETLDATGTCTINIKQFAPLVNTLTNLFKEYDTNFSSYESVMSEVRENGTTTYTDGGLDQATKIEVYYAGRLLGVAQGCYLNMPELGLQEENDSRDFAFECGIVQYEVLDNSLISTNVAQRV